MMHTDGFPLRDARLSETPRWCLGVRSRCAKVAFGGSASMTDDDENGR